MSKLYHLVHAPTDMVVNYHTAASGSAIEAGGRLSLWPITGSNDQIWRLEYHGDAVYMHCMRNEAYAVNKHSKTAQAIMWRADRASAGDSLLDTRTENGVMRVYLAEQPELFLTAESTAKGDDIHFAKGAALYFGPKADDALQHFRFEEVVATSGADTSKATTLAIAPINQLAYPTASLRNAGCLATCLEQSAKYYGYNVGINDLVAKGCVASTAFVNTPLPYVDWWPEMCVNAAESTYCQAIINAINAGHPVVVKMVGGSADHFVLAVGYTAATPEGILVNDSSGGVQRTLRQALNAAGKKYRHIRICKRG